MATRDLTAKQESFAQAIVDGLNQSDAYRHAYDTSNMRPETLWVKASELANDDKVSVRIQVLRDLAAEISTAARAWNVDRIVEESETNLRLGRFLGQISAANGSIATIGKATGLLVDRHEVSGSIHVYHETSLDALLALIPGGEAAALESAPYKETVVEGTSQVMDESDAG